MQKVEYCEFTKQEFRKLMDTNEVDIRANNVVYYNNDIYEIKVDDKENKVFLIKAKDVKYERN